MSIPPKAPPVYKPAATGVAAPSVYRPNQVNPPGVQLKSAKSFRLETRPAPPVYRPQQGDKPTGQQLASGVQRKSAISSKLETRPAPPIYRPQVTNSPGVQTKSANHFKSENCPAPLVYHRWQRQTDLQPKADGRLPIENRIAPPIYRPQEFSPRSAQLKSTNFRNTPAIAPKPLGSSMVQHKIQTTAPFGQILARSNFQLGNLLIPGVVQPSSTRGGRGGRQHGPRVTQHSYPRISREPYYVPDYNREQGKHYDRRVLRASASVRYAIGYYDSEGKLQKDWYDFDTPMFNSGKSGRGWTYGGAWRGRTHDAEAKVYRWIYDYFVEAFGNFLDAVAEIVVNLASEEGPCNSCRAVRRKFKEKFDCDVTVNTLAGKSTYYQDIKSKSLRKQYGRDRVTYGHTRTKKVLRRSGSPARFETLDSDASDSEE